MHTLHMGLFGTSSCALITVAVTVLACGAVLFYCHTRMQQMELALMKQHHVLSSFISNIENEIRNGSLMMSGGAAAAAPDHATPEALAAARTLQQTAAANRTDSRIEVSEDEDTSDDSDSDSDEDEDVRRVEVVDDGAYNMAEGDDSVLNDTVSDTVSDTVPRLKVSDLPTRDTKDDIKIIELISSKTVGADIITASDITSACVDDSLTLTPVDLNLFIESDDDAEEDDDSDSEQLDPPVNNTLITVSKVLPVAYDILKVDDLRKTVVKQALATKEEAKKLKKTELLALLKSAESQQN